MQSEMKPVTTEMRLAYLDLVARGMDAEEKNAPKLPNFLAGVGVLMMFVGLYIHYECKLHRMAEAHNEEMSRLRAINERLEANSRQVAAMLVEAPFSPYNKNELLAMVDSPVNAL